MASRHWAEPIRDLVVRSGRRPLTGRRFIRAEAVAQNKPVSVGADDGHSPPAPGRPAGGDPLATRTDQLIDGLLVDEAAEVKHQNGLVG